MHSKKTSKAANAKRFWQTLSSPMLILSLGCLTGTAAFAQDIPEGWHEVVAQADPMLDNLSIPANAATQGMWSDVFPWPMNGLHSIVLSDGRVLTFGTTGDGEDQDGRTYDVWDSRLGFGSSSHNTVFDPTRQDSFCAAAVYLGDGSLMISGGNGEDTSTIYDSASHTSTDAPVSMAENRWYPTLITLADGRPIIMGGMVPYTEEMVDFPSLAIARGWPSMTPEVFEGGQWRSLFGAYSRLAFGPDYLRTSYPRAWVAPDGRVFGISAEQMWYLDADADAGSGSITSAGVFKGPFSDTAPVNVGATNTAVMFAPGKILQVGGNGGFNGDELPASNMATLVDITGDNPVLQEQTPMQYPRRYPNSVVLATGEVVITGGATYGNNYPEQNADAVYAVEIWNPATGTWSIGADAAIYRGYHSITSLMPNGTILSTGGGTPGPVTNLNGEVYYPPYLFQNTGSGAELAPRPVITALSDVSIANEAAMQLRLSSADAVADVVLLGTSNGTHSFNSGQRRIPLSFSQAGTDLTVTMPAATLAPPGYYQLVVINGNGVPSVGAIIGVGQGQENPPIITDPYYPAELEQPIATPNIGAGQTVNYSLQASTGTTYRWSFGDGTVTEFIAEGTVSHTYEAPGIYLVTLTAKSSEGQQAIRTFVQTVATEATATQPMSSANIVYEITQTGDRVWTVNPDNDTVTVLSASTYARIAEIAVGENPRSLAIAPDGRIWVTNKDSATISIINQSTLSVVSTLDLAYASQPYGIVFSPTSNEAFVALEATGTLLKLNATTGATIGSNALASSIRHLAISGDGNTLLVSRFITPPVPGEFTADVSTIGQGGQVLVVNPATLTTNSTVVLAYSNAADTEISGSGLPNYLVAPVIAPDGSSAWVPSKQDNITRGTLRSGQNLDFQNTVRAIASKINLNTFAELREQRVDLDNASIASAAAFHPNGVFMFISLETSREVALVNALNGSELLRIDTGFAPQGLVVSDDGRTLFVKEFLSRTVTAFDLTNLLDFGELTVTELANTNTVSSENLSANVLLGKQLFYDARDPRLANDAYLSCATCHNEEGQDGRVWDLTGFGEGLRNTIALAGRGGMAQGLLHWSGNFDEIQDFEKQIRDLAGGTGLMNDADYNSGTTSLPLGNPKAGYSNDLDALAAYLSSLTTFAASPLRDANGDLTAAAQSGETLFNQECVSCHGGVNFTISDDVNAMRDIGTISLDSGQRLGGNFTAVDVPTLRDVWATAPYLHDGSAPTVATAISAHQDISLSVADMTNVVAYVNQIGDAAGPDDSNPEEEEEEKSGSLGHALLLLMLGFMLLGRRRVH